MAGVQTQFKAVTFGFQFPNRFELHFPVKYSIPLIGTLDLSDVVFGLCGGMCFTALDFYQANQQIPQYKTVEGIDKKLYTYLCERQLDSLKISVVLKVIEWMLLENRDVASRMTRTELPKLRKMIDKGEPAVLALVRVQGLGDLTHNHQVLATGYELDAGAKSMAVTLYDPNHPGEQPTINLNLGNPGTAGWIVQSTGEALRGFFIIPYQARTTFPKAGLEEGVSFGAPAEALPFKLQWPVDSRRVNQFFGENPDSYKPFGLPGHEGLDLFAITGANVYAAADGEVTEADQPKDHPYGMQIRLVHQAGGKTFRTVYAHLSKILVQKGQKVKAGDLIGLADNTGNSFGSHLHLTLKIDGETTPGYPASIVDPWPYLQETTTPPPPPGSQLPPPSGVTVYTRSQLNLLAEANPGAKALTLLPAGEALIVLGDADAARTKIGAQGQWLQVQTAGGLAGFVDASLVQDTQQAFPPSDLVIYPFDEVNLRSGPGTAFNLLATLVLTDPLTVLGDADSARAKIGKQGEWIQIETGSGMRGFVAAWLVHLTGQAAPPTGLVVFPQDFVNVRARASTDANVLTVAAPGDPLAVLGDKSLAQASIGQAGQWLNVRTPSQFVGYVAAWLIQAGGGTPTPPPPDTSKLVIFPAADINLRAQASVNSPRVGGAFHNEPLTVIEGDLNAAKAKIGQANTWIYVQNKGGQRGWAAAWFVSATTS